MKGYECGIWVCIALVPLELCCHSDGGTLTLVTGISALLKCSLLTLFGKRISWLTYSLGVGYQQHWGCWRTCLPIHIRLSFGPLFLPTWVKSNVVKARQYLNSSRFSVFCEKESRSSEGTTVLSQICQIQCSHVWLSSENTSTSACLWNIWAHVGGRGSCMYSNLAVLVCKILRMKWDYFILIQFG